MKSTENLRLASDGLEYLLRVSDRQFSHNVEQLLKLERVLEWGFYFVTQILDSAKLSGEVLDLWVKHRMEGRIPYFQSFWQYSLQTLHIFNIYELEISDIVSHVFNELLDSIFSILPIISHLLFKDPDIWVSWDISKYTWLVNMHCRRSQPRIQ